MPISQWTAALGAMLLTAGPAHACVDTTLRDAAFSEPRDMYRLTVMSEADDARAEQTYGRLKEWLSVSGADLNVEAFRVNVDDPQVRWPDYGIPSAPPTSPAVVLGCYRQVEMQSLFVDHWEPAPNHEELEQLRTSPVRERLQRELGRNLAVLLYIPAGGAGAGRVKTVLDNVLEEWSHKTSLSLSILQVDRSDPRERLLMAFTGALRSDTDWVAVVFGRGKFMPPLQGDDVTAEAVDGQLQVLMEDCACVRSVSSLGVDIPMVWTKALDKTITPLAAQADGSPQTQPSPAAPDAAVKSGGNRVLSVVAYTFSGLAVVAVAACAIILLRPIRRRP